MAAGRKNMSAHCRGGTADAGRSKLGIELLQVCGVLIPSYRA
jgi:hypothetical protein